jgi:hypothetical protein
MDEGRYHDFNKLTAVLNNPAESARHKRQASRALAKIKLKMNDPFIKSERARLIRAQQAGDVDEAGKISDSISDYETRKYGRS